MNILLEIDSNTLTSLKDAGEKLYFFRKSYSSSVSGVAVAYDIVVNYLSNNNFIIQPVSGAYLSSAKINPNKIITIGNSVSVSLGQTVTVTNSLLSVSPTAPDPDAVFFNNEDSDNWVMGLLAPLPSDNTTLGNFNALTTTNIALTGCQPTNTILLMWSSANYQLGAVIVDTLSPSLLINLDNSSGTSNITYSSSGWGCSGSEASDVPVNVPLSNYLFCPTVNKPFL